MIIFDNKPLQHPLDAAMPSPSKNQGFAYGHYIVSQVVVCVFDQSQIKRLGGARNYQCRVVGD